MGLREEMFKQIVGNNQDCSQAYFTSQKPSPRPFCNLAKYSVTNNIYTACSYENCPKVAAIIQAITGAGYKSPGEIERLINVGNKTDSDMGI